MSPVTVIHVKITEFVNWMNQGTTDSNVNVLSLLLDKNVKDGVKYYTSNISNDSTFLILPKYLTASFFKFQVKTNPSLNCPKLQRHVEAQLII